MPEIYVGTYASPQSPGIFRLTLDSETGAFSTPALFCAAPDSKHLAFASNGVYSTICRDGKAGLCAAEHDGNIFAERLTEGTAPCYVAPYDGLIYTANYHEGNVLVYNERLDLVHKIEIAVGAGCHQTFFCANVLFVPCLKLDAIKLFDIAKGFTPIGEIRFPAGSGPRHGVFGRDGKLYVICELTSELYTLIRSGDSFEIEHCLSVAASEGNASAAIRLHPEYELLYLSTRGENIISLVDISAKPILLQQKPSGGNHPRDFCLTPDGGFLVAANRDSDNLVCFKLFKDGKIGNIKGLTNIPLATALIIR